MKIVCESCGAKYSIADEKVAGKVFKIRCKKCSSVIVVKGDAQEDGEEATRVFDYGAEAVWHVVVGGDQQGPFAPRQIADMLAESKIDWEAYVWREGMDGWQPAKDVEALVSAVMAEAEGGAPGPSAPAYGTGQVFGGSSDMGADPFAGGDDGGLSGVMGQAAVGASAAGGGADLFAKAGRSPFAGSAEPEASMSNGHSPRVSEEALTGQRNENSVLFSLSNLQALATGSGGAPQSSRPKPGMAAGEGSGLIDIRALASASQAVAEGKTNGAAKESVQDLLAVGSANAFSTASLAAPIAAESDKKSPLLIGGIVGLLVVVIGLLGVIVMREPSGETAAAAAPAAQPAAPAAAAAQAAVAPTAPSAAEPTKDAPTEQAAATEDKSASDKSGSSREERSGRRKESGSTAKSSDKPSGSASAGSAPSAPTPAPSSKSSGDKSLDDLLDSALSGKPSKPAAAAKAEPAEPAANLPQLPGRDDVLSAMKGVTPRVQSCGNGQSGVAMAKVTVAGPTGRVSNVEVSGSFAGTPVAACVVREVSKAKFPKFQQSTFSVTYPFKI